MWLNIGEEVARYSNSWGRIPLDGEALLRDGLGNAFNLRNQCLLVGPHHHREVLSSHRKIENVVRRRNRNEQLSASRDFARPLQGRQNREGVPRILSVAETSERPCRGRCLSFLEAKATPFDVRSPRVEFLLVHIFLERRMARENPMVTCDPPMCSSDLAVRHAAHSWSEDSSRRAHNLLNRTEWHRPDHMNQARLF